MFIIFATALSPVTLGAGSGSGSVCMSRTSSMFVASVNNLATHQHTPSPNHHTNIIPSATTPQCTSKHSPNLPKKTWRLQASFLGW